MITEYVKNWLQRADDDLKLIEIVLKEPSFSPNPLCFHAQQSVEKYLKGFLAHNDLHARKIHDLEALVGDCAKIDKSFEELQNDARFLNQFYIESRYPDDYTQFSPDKAKEAYEIAIKIKNFVLEKINEKQKGFILPIILVIAAVAVFGAAGYFVYQKEVKKEADVLINTTIGVNSTSTEKSETQPIALNTTKEQVVCTQDAKQCPDGSYVSRTGPNCEFASCQEMADETADWKTYRNDKYGFKIQYPTNFSLTEHDYADWISVMMDGPKDCQKENSEFYCFDDYVSIEVNSNARNLTLAEFIGENYVVAWNQQGFKQIGGKEFTIFIPTDSEASRIMYGYTDKKNKKLFFVIVMGGVENVVTEKILSTFKFTK